jgi:hypothetical protein
MLSSNTGLLPSLQVITGMITPAILILAAGSLVSSTLVRIGRIVDQTRRLIARGEEMRRADNQASLKILDEQLDLLMRRNDLARSALRSYYVAISLFLLSSLVLGLTVLFQSHLIWVGPVIVMLGAIFLFLGSAALVVEVNVSGNATRHEVALFRSGAPDPLAEAANDPN